MLSSSSFLPSPTLLSSSTSISPLPIPLRLRLPRRPPRPRAVTITSSATRKIVRFPALDRRASSHLRLRFARKLTTLLLSKPRHFLPIRALRRCLAYLRPSRPLLPMIFRYPTLFRFLRSTSGFLAVGLTPAALSLALHESSLRSSISASLSVKLQKLLLLSSRRVLPISKLLHLAPDLGLPRNFVTSLLPRFPTLFRTVDTPDGLFLHLLSSDPSIAVPLPPPAFPSPSPPPIISRPARFTPVRLRRGLNLKRRHAVFLERFTALPEVNPYAETAAAEGGLGERRAVAVVREVLAMMVDRRMLVDNLTHFRREFGLPNKLYAMLVRHPELFYVSVKGVRHSVFLLEGYDDKGKLVEVDDIVAARRRLAELVQEGKRMRRVRRRGIGVDVDEEEEAEEELEEEERGWGLVDEEGHDGDLGDLFEVGVGEDWEDWNGLVEEVAAEELGEFWRMKDGVEGVDVW